MRSSGRSAGGAFVETTSFFDGRSFGRALSIAFVCRGRVLSIGSVCRGAGPPPIPPGGEVRIGLPLGGGALIGGTLSGTPSVSMRSRFVV